MLWRGGVAARTCRRRRVLRERTLGRAVGGRARHVLEGRGVVAAELLDPVRDRRRELPASPSSRRRRGRRSSGSPPRTARRRGRGASAAAAPPRVPPPVRTSRRRRSRRAAEKHPATDPGRRRNRARHASRLPCALHGHAAPARTLDALAVDRPCGRCARRCRAVPRGVRARRLRHRLRDGSGGSGLVGRAGGAPRALERSRLVVRRTRCGAAPRRPGRVDADLGLLGGKRRGRVRRLRAERALPRAARPRAVARSP